MNSYVFRALTTCTKTNSRAVGAAVLDANSVLKKIIVQDAFDKKSEQEDEQDDYEDMFVQTEFNDTEWGGPLRGGKMPEPTRYGDWERKGRCSDY